MTEARVTTRLATAADEAFIWEMLYYAAWMDVEGDKTPADAKTNAFLMPFAQGWGADTDLGVIAEDSQTGRPLGAAWVRVLAGSSHQYAMVAEGTPELAIAVRPEAVGRGIGSLMLGRLLDEARGRFAAIVLIVRDTNPAKRLYERHGFGVVDQTTNRVGGLSYVMVVELP